MLYNFSEQTIEMAMHRLKRLKRLNSTVRFHLLFGSRQLLFIPMIYDPFMFGSKYLKIPLSKVLHAINWIFLQAPGVFKLSLKINEAVTPLVKSGLLASTRNQIKQLGFDELHVDYTPIALWNLDSGIMNWYKHVGKHSDFDYLIFYESDIYSTKPLDSLYQKYASLYDACFVDFEVPPREWHFNRFPLGSRRATIKWLKKKGLSTTIYRSIFAGAMISRRCLEKLSKLGLDFSGSPYCQNEMRLPTVLSALGFRVGRLDFPFVRYRPEFQVNEIDANFEAGIFHPVKKALAPELLI